MNNSFFCDSVNSHMFVAIYGKKTTKKPLKAVQHIQQCSRVCFYEKKLGVFTRVLTLLSSAETALLKVPGYTGADGRHMYLCWSATVPH